MSEINMYTHGAYNAFQLVKFELNLGPLEEILVA